MHAIMCICDCLFVYLADTDTRRRRYTFRWHCDSQSSVNAYACDLFAAIDDEYIIAL